MEAHGGHGEKFYFKLRTAYEIVCFILKKYQNIFLQIHILKW